MKRRALISKTELHRMAAVAKEHGVIVEKVDANGVILRVSPMEAPASAPLTLLDSPDFSQSPPIEPELNHREKSVLEFLMEVGVGVPFHASAIKFAGPLTIDSLEHRGFVTVSLDKGGKKSDLCIALTKKAVDDMKAQKAFMKAYYEAYPML